MSKSESRTQWMSRKGRTRQPSSAEQAKRIQLQAERDALMREPLNPGGGLSAKEREAERVRVHGGLIRQHGSGPSQTWQRGKN